MWFIVSGEKLLLIALIVAKIATKILTLFFVGVENISAWIDNDVLFSIILHNCVGKEHYFTYMILHINIFSMIRVRKNSWIIRWCNKNILKKKLHALKMRKVVSIIKHIQIFRVHLIYFLVKRSKISNDEAIFILMRSLFIVLLFAF